MSQKLTSNRQVYVEKCGHYLVIDIGHPMSPPVLEIAISTVENILGLASALRGTDKIPLFGLSVINGQFQSLLRICTLKGNFRRISNALNDIYSMAKVTERPTEEDFNDNLLLALKSALEEFKPSEYTNGDSLILSKLEVTMITMKSGLAIQTYLESALATLNSNKLRRIKLIEMAETCSYSCDDQSRSVRLIKVTREGPELEKTLKEWLSDWTVDCEQLILNLGNVQIKCDITESVLDPASLPFGQRFLLKPDTLALQPYKSTDGDVAQYELVVVSRLSNAGVCESHVFGQPIHITASRNSSIPNQQKFFALCESLTATEDYLLAKLSTADPPYGFFVLMPGPAMILAKSVAPGEMVLPARDTVHFNDLPPAIVSQINACLGELKKFEEYKPERVESEIYSAIRTHFHSSKKMDAKKNKQSDSNNPYSKPGTQHRVRKPDQNQEMLKYYRNKQNLK